MVSGLDLFAGIVVAFCATLVVVNVCLPICDHFCADPPDGAQSASALDDLATTFFFSSGSLVSFAGYIVIWLILGFRGM